MVNNNIYKSNFVETPRKLNYYCKAFHLRARIFINAVVSTFISAHYQCSLYQCSLISTFHQCISCSHCTVRACINISVFELLSTGGYSTLFGFVLLYLSFKSYSKHFYCFTVLYCFAYLAQTYTKPSLRRTERGCKSNRPKAVIRRRKSPQGDYVHANGSINS